MGSHSQTKALRGFRLIPPLHADCRVDQVADWPNDGFHDKLAT
jgi:hypothetical protein